MTTTTKEDCAYLAKTPEAQGYWGRHKDGVHHAIASCCDAGANRFGIFVVYHGGPSLACDPIWGNLQWNEGEPEPTLDGIYTAQGCWLAENLAELAEEVRKDPERYEAEYALDRDTIKALKNHKPE